MMNAIEHFRDSRGFSAEASAAGGAAAGVVIGAAGVERGSGGVGGGGESGIRNDLVFALILKLYTGQQDTRVRRLYHYERQQEKQQQQSYAQRRSSLFAGACVSDDAADLPLFVDDGTSSTTSATAAAVGDAFVDEMWEMEAATLVRELRSPSNILASEVKRVFHTSNEVKSCIRDPGVLFTWAYGYCSY